ncbi:MAG: D-aminoacyl-tRNA deacylase [Candidatus Omnitrophota bacterium]
MRVVVQRVKESSVAVGGEKKSEITGGFMLLVGVAKDDTLEVIEAMAKKISKLRVFEDEEGKMNMDLAQVGGKVLSVPQFTLLGRTDKGNRPGFDDAADPVKAEDYWKRFNEVLRAEGLHVAEGEFGAHMEVSLVNDGPVTFVLDLKEGGSK